MKSVYKCNNCGYTSPRWYGKCPMCSEWNTLEESEEEAPLPKTMGRKSVSKEFAPLTSPSAAPIKEIKFQKYMRLSTGIGEFDRVLGGGLVNSSVVLLSGEPGIGKSTLLLQICQFVGENNRILYVSGEESPSQIKLRAERIGVESDNLSVLSESNINKVIPEIVAASPEVVIIDSIQTMYDDTLQSTPGSVTQVKQTAMMLIAKAKECGISMIIVGHVNKDGAIAGPKVLEHMVDAVLYFEGDRQHAYRIIRAVKNRFGSTNEIGVFEMDDDGLTEVPNPSETLLEQRPIGVSGSCAVCVMEGSRPIIAEIQALTTPTYFPSPRRTSSGIDYNKLNILLAVLEKRLGLKYSTHDVFMNVIAGLRLDEPAVDLAVALALISSYKDIPVDPDLIAFGEIGLAGEARSVFNIETRINESRRLGFKRIAVPARSIARLKKKSDDLIPVKSVYDLSRILGDK